jgi:low temperature requirement protein LtrA
VNPTAPATTAHRVSNFELLFDLVFVFAFTQVTGVMLGGHSAESVLQAIVVLGLIWGSWTSYAWLANQLRSDGGILRGGLTVAMILMFVLALAIPGAFHPAGGDPTSAIVLVVCFVLVRIVHNVIYLSVAGDDRALRRQVLVTNGISLPVTLALLLVGALLGGAWQPWIWLAAALTDAGIVAVTSIGGSWRIHSPAHWAERFGLVVMLALGESVVSIGVGVASEPLHAAVIAGAVLSVAGAVVLWWLYFHRLSAGAEEALARRSGVERADAATVGYTYLHFAVVAGVILTATGIETTMHEITSPEPLGWFGAAALAGGVSLYQAATVFFWRRMTGTWLVVRLVVSAALLPGVVIAAVLPPLAALGIAVFLGVVLNLVERRVWPRRVATADEVPAALAD